MRGIIRLGLLAGVLGLWACNSSPILEEQVFSQACWTYQDTLRWSLKAPEQQQMFIDFTEDYPYRNLHVKLWLTYPGGRVIDTVWQANIVDSMGYWLAVPVDRFHRHAFSQPFARNGKIPQSIQIIHYMRDSSLCGVSRVGLISQRSGG